MCGVYLSNKSETVLFLFRKQQQQQLVRPFKTHTEYLMFASRILSADDINNYQLHDWYIDVSMHQWQTPEEFFYLRRGCEISQSW